ncbi:Crp/Fnr family transcriptional regulator [Mesorhizobium sp. ANAO-SY3R2]|uniref:Crp/Fnr family transcriptional regulator n=1 Tax=Mesorhizobium sp. ANAO-SY3R2 TaxID=3166644 RepID=UPI0036732F5F
MFQAAASVMPNRLRLLPHFSASAFGSLGDDVCLALENAASYRMLAANEFIYLQEDDADFLYFVRSGHVRLSYLLEDGSPILFGVLPPGESFGELGVFEGGQHYDMATAIGAGSIYCIPATVFHALSQRYPDLNLALARTIAQRYRSYISLTRILGLKTLQSRLSQCLLRVADGLGDRTEYLNRTVLRVRAFITQSDLGLIARGARGNVNRALKGWERDGLIAIQDRNILILDRSSLEAIALEDDLSRLRHG